MLTRRPPPDTRAAPSVVNWAPWELLRSEYGRFGSSFCWNWGSELISHASPHSQLPSTIVPISSRHPAANTRHAVVASPPRRRDGSGSDGSHSHGGSARATAGASAEPAWKLSTSWRRSGHSSWQLQALQTLQTRQTPQRLPGPLGTRRSKLSEVPGGTAGTTTIRGLYSSPWFPNHHRPPLMRFSRSSAAVVCSSFSAVILL